MMKKKKNGEQTQEDTIQFILGKKSPGTHAQILRVIGQALNKLHVKTFELKIQGNKYFLRAEATKPLLKKSRIQNGLKSQLWALRRRFQGPYRAKHPSVVFELRYTPQDINDLESKGQARRQDPKGMPDAYSLSEILRVVGAYVDLKGARLLEVSKQGQWVTIRYQTAQDRTHMEKVEISSFYAIFVRMYLRRSDRTWGTLNLLEKEYYYS
jgi:hypothetical protein